MLLHLIVVTVLLFEVHKELDITTFLKYFVFFFQIFPHFMFRELTQKAMDLFLNLFLISLVKLKVCCPYKFVLIRAIYYSYKTIKFF